MQNPNIGEPFLLTTHRNYARNVVARFRLCYPLHHFRLYESPGEHHFWVHVQDAGEQFAALAERLEHDFRPISLPLRLIPEVGRHLVPVDETQDFASEAWLNGHPLSVWEVNHLLQLTAVNMPVGALDMAEHREAWLFKTAVELTPEERDRVTDGVAKLGCSGPIEFACVPLQTPGFSADHRLEGQQVAPLVMSSSASSAPIRRLIERDEDHWRQSLDGRFQVVVEPPFEPSVSACLFDAGVEGPVGLSELLTLYDRIDVIPDRSDPRWLSRLELQRDDFVQLVAMKRCRLVIPFSADLCRPDVLEAVAEIDPEGVVLSRQLAARARAAAMRKDPLLYGPFSQAERTAVLQALGRVTTAPFYTAMLGSYADIFERQHWQMAMHGAMACAFSGIGWHLAEVHRRQHGRDACLEMGIAGAGMEWAMALGATWIPRHFGQGYDETHNCHMLASFMGRTSAVVQDPVGPRMHLLTDGLLALSGVPPMEVARNFDAAAVRDFRTLSRRVLHEAVTLEEMAAAVQRINIETERFESRLERLAKWKIHSLLAGVVAKPVMDLADEQISPYASVTVAWMADVIYSKLPPETQAQALQMLKSMLGFALAPSADAVVVSRSRAALRS